MDLTTPSQQPTCLIADDEPLLRAHLRAMLTAAWPGLRIVAEAGDGLEATAAMNEHRPHVAFLDIHMPGATGLDMARAYGRNCEIVFVTAHPDHALEAYGAGVSAYLLKPIELPALAAVIDKLRSRLAPAAPAELSTPSLSAARQGDGVDPGVDQAGQVMRPRHLQWIQASLGNEIRFITCDEVIYFQSDLKYTRIVTEGGEALVRKPIKELIEELDPDRFWQVQRGAIVSLKHLRGVVRDGDGNMEVVLRSHPDRIRVSRGYQDRFRQI